VAPRYERELVLRCLVAAINADVNASIVETNQEERDCYETAATEIERLPQKITNGLAETEFKLVITRYEPQVLTFETEYKLSARQRPGAGKTDIKRESLTLA
jgi:hypothetical protein